MRLVQKALALEEAPSKGSGVELRSFLMGLAAAAIAGVGGGTGGGAGGGTGAGGGAGADVWKEGY